MLKIGIDENAYCKRYGFEKGLEYFKLSKAYESKVDVINVITAPEIEMLIIFNEEKYNEFKKSGKKPSIFCKENLKMSSVKSYDFVNGKKNGMENRFFLSFGCLVSPCVWILKN